MDGNFVHVSGCKGKNNIFVGVVFVVGYAAMSWGEWESLIWGQPSRQMVVPAQITVESLPLPLGASVRVSRARRLVEDGRLNQALDVLAMVGSGNSLTKEADALRAEIQRQLLSLPSVPVFSTGSRVDSPR